MSRRKTQTTKASYYSSGTFSGLSELVKPVAIGCGFIVFSGLMLTVAFFTIFNIVGWWDAGDTPEEKPIAQVTMPVEDDIKPAELYQPPPKPTPAKPKTPSRPYKPNPDLEKIDLSPALPTPPPPEPKPQPKPEPKPVPQPKPEIVAARPPVEAPKPVMPAKPPSLPKPIPVKPEPPPVPLDAFEIRPIKGWPIPLATTKAGLESYVSARARKNQSAMDLMVENEQVFLAEETITVSITLKSEKWATVRVYGPFEGKEFYIDTLDLPREKR